MLENVDDSGNIHDCFPLTIGSVTVSVTRIEHVLDDINYNPSENEWEINLVEFKERQPAIYKI